MASQGDECPSWLEKHRWAEEREEAPGEEPQTTTSPLPTTNKSNPCIPGSEASALRDHPQLETSKPSAATEYGRSKCDPGEQSAPGRPCNTRAVATSLHEGMGWKGTCPQYLRTWQSESPPDRSSLGRCLSAFQVTEPRWMAWSLTSPSWQ